MIAENAAIRKAYLACTFEEPAEIIEGMFERLDQGAADGHAQVTSDAMAAFVALTRQPSLAGARELLLDLCNPEVISIEI